MGFTTKQNLINAKFCQDQSGSLNLSGTTNFGSASYLQTPTINNPLQIPNAGWVSGLTDNLGNNKVDCSDFNTYTATTDTRISTAEGDISTNETNISNNTNSITANTENIGINETNITELSGLTSSSICTANNGLTQSGRNVRLGGSLTGDTTINGTGHDLCITSNYLNVGSISEFSSDEGKIRIDGTVGGTIQFCVGTGGQVNLTGGGLAYNGDYSGDNINNDRWIVDKEYVDTSVNSLTATTSQAVTGATNGITKVGQDVELGGVLTKNTFIDTCNNYGIAIGGVGYYNNLCAVGSNSFVVGRSGYDPHCVTGDNSVLLGGFGSVITSVNSGVVGGCSHQVCSNESAIIGGRGNVIRINNTCSAIIGGDNIDVADGTLPNHAIVPNLAVWETPGDGNNDDLLTWNSTSKKVTKTSKSSIFTNGLCYNEIESRGELGGTLIKNTVIDGNTGTHNLSLVDLNEFNTSFNSAIITDNGSGEGLKYVADYSTTFVDRSLVDKAYVDAAAGGIGATNGLTREGDNIVLGGSLVSGTTIYGPSDLNIDSPFYAADIQTFKFNTNPTITGHTDGRLYYKNNSLNLDKEISGVTLQLGEENITRVTNTTGSVIENGSIVRYTGVVSGIPTIDKSIATDFDQTTKSFGVVTSDINDSQEGYVTTLGKVRNVNTSGYAAGDMLWLSDTTAGGYTNIRPSYPNYSFSIGIVTKVGSTDGEIYVKPLYVPNYTEYGEFTGYTATTTAELNNKLDTTIFDSYTATTDTRISDIEEVTDVALTGATNGTTKNGREVELGGALNRDTNITGAYNLRLSPSGNLVLRTPVEDNILIDGQSNTSVVLRSQSGNNTNLTSFTNAVGIQMDYNQASGFAIYDNRISSNQTGIIYAGDYSTNFVDRSLVDKAYVDSIAAGLQAKSAVEYATTTDIDLTGGTFGGTIDGATVVDGDRVLVKNQTDKVENGIYVYSSGTTTFTRAEDYDGTPTGEVSNGDLIPVLSGNTNKSSQWILTTQDPISIDSSELEFSKFSQLLDISAGDGVNINTVGGSKQISVDLASGSGLEFRSGNLSVANEIAGSGLTWNSGVVNVNASSVGASGSEVPVRFGTGNDLFVDSDDFQTVTANNGITLNTDIVELGGTLNRNTGIDGDSGTHNFGITGINILNLSFNDSSITSINQEGLKYSSDLSSTFVDRSLVDKAYVDNTVTGDTLTFNNGLTKNGDTISWGGFLTGDTFVGYGNGRICMENGGASVLTFASDCTRLQIQETNAQLRSCTNASCSGSINVNTSGEIDITTNNATTGITITDTGSGVGATYASDYSSSFVSRSLVDKGYVDTCVNSIEILAVTGGTNGITKVGQDVELGGILEKDVTISGGTSYANSYTINLGTDLSKLSYFNVRANDSFDVVAGERGRMQLGYCQSTMAFCSDNDNFSRIYMDLGGISVSVCDVDNNNNKAMYYTDDYSSMFTPRSIPDVAYVTGLTSTIESNGITGGTNGITKVGQDVELGGTLTKDTCICTNNQYGLAIGNNAEATGSNSFAGGTGYSPGDTSASGPQSFAFGYAVCATASNSVILGGNNQFTNSPNSGIIAGVGNNIAINNGGAVILGGNGITISDNSLPEHAIVPNLAIWETPETGTLSNGVLVWDNTDKKVKQIDGSNLGEDNNRYNTTGVTNSTINLTGDEYVVLVDTSLGAVTVNLPASPDNNTALKIKDKGNALANNITIDGNGNTIDGDTDAVINTDYGALELVYDGSEWFTLAFIN